MGNRMRTIRSTVGLRRWRVAGDGGDIVWAHRCLGTCSKRSRHAMHDVTECCLRLSLSTGTDAKISG